MDVLNCLYLCICPFVCLSTCNLSGNLLYSICIFYVSKDGNLLVRSFALCSFAQNRSLTMSNRERIAFIACFWQFFSALPLFIPKNKLLPSLFAPSLFFKERPWAICSFPKVNHSQKTSDSLWKPKSKFPTLLLFVCLTNVRLLSVHLSLYLVYCMCIVFCFFFLIVLSSPSHDFSHV